MAQVVVFDESVSGNPIREFTLELPEEQIAVRELIRSRVYQEAREVNAKVASKSHASAKPAIDLDPEEILCNGPCKTTPVVVDWKLQFDRALEAFQKRQILILVDDRQATSLDEEFRIRPTTNIRFLRLTMLMGG